jgi:hypothetical protein
MQLMLFRILPDKLRFFVSISDRLRQQFNTRSAYACVFDFFQRALVKERVPLLRT